MDSNERDVDLQARIQAAWEAMGRARHVEALDLWDEILGGDPESLQGTVGRGISLLYLGASDGARILDEIAARLQQPAHDTPADSMALALTLRALMRFDDALAAVDRAIAFAEPGSAIAMEAVEFRREIALETSQPRLPFDEHVGGGGFDSGDAGNWVRLGRTLIVTGQTGEGVRAVDRAHRLGLVNVEVDRWVASALINSRAFDEARRHATSRLVRHPRDYGLYTYLALAELGMNDHVRAREAASIASDLTPDDERLPITLSDIHLALGDVEMALAALGRGALVYPDSVDILLSQANLLIEARQFSRAAPIAQALVALNPNSTEVQLMAAGIHFLAGDHLSTVEAARRAIALDPGNPAAVELLGRTFKEEGQRMLELAAEASEPGQRQAIALLARNARESFLRAVDLFERCLLIAPENAEVHRYLAETWMLLEQPQKALPLLVQADTLGPEDPATALLIEQVNDQLADRDFTLNFELQGARQATSSGDYAAALQHWRRVVTIDPKSIEGRVGQGISLLRLNDTTGRSLLEKVVAQLQQAPPSTFGDGLGLAMALSGLGRFDAALMAVDRAITLTEGGAAPELAAMEMRRDILLQASPAHDGFEEYLRNGRDPRLAENWVELARLMVGRGLVTEAGVAIGRANEMGMRDPSVDRWFARVLIEGERYHSAYIHASDSLIRHPEDYGLQVCRAAAALRTNNLTGARAAAAEAARRPPDDVDLCDMLAAVYLDLGEYDRALAALEAGVRAFPDSCWGLLGHQATLLTNHGRFSEAAAALDRRANLDPGSTEAHIEASDAHRRAGEYNEAVAAAARALALEPRNPMAIATLARVCSADGEQRMLDAQALPGQDPGTTQAAIVGEGTTPSPSNEPVSMRELLVREGQALIQQSIGLFSDALVGAPNDASIHRDLGYAWILLSEPKKAQASLAQATHIDSGDIHTQQLNQKVRDQLLQQFRTEKGLGE